MFVGVKSTYLIANIRRVILTPTIPIKLKYSIVINSNILYIISIKIIYRITHLQIRHKHVCDYSSNPKDLSALRLSSSNLPDYPWRPIA